MLTFLRTQSAAISGAIVAVLNALVLLHVLNISAEQIGGINVALAAVLAIFVYGNSTPSVKVAAFTPTLGGSVVSGPADDSHADGTRVNVTKA